MKVVTILLVVALCSCADADLLEWPVADGGNGHWYAAVAIEPGISWDNANAAAVADGGYLASITSAAENTFIYNLVSDIPSLWRHDPDNSIGPWLGGYQLPGSAEPDVGWAWTSGEPFVYTNWGPYEPNNSSGIEDRLQLFGWRTDTGEYWNDYPNSEMFFENAVGGYVVEYDQPVPEPATLLLFLAGASVLSLMLARRRKRR